MNPERFFQRGLLLLVPAPAVFGVDALLQALGQARLPWPFFAVVGALSAIGMLSLLIATQGTPDFWRIGIAVLIAVLGHYVIDDLVDPDLGAAMVYLGTGFAASLRVPLAAYAGILAGAGAMLRGQGDVGQWVLAAGALLLAVLLTRGAAGAFGETATDTDAADT